MEVTNGIVKIYLSSTSAQSVTYSWTVTTTGTVAGATSGSGNMINQVVTGYGTITYRVTATEIATGCRGIPVDIVITVPAVGNTQKSGVAIKECPMGQTGSTETYTVLANTYFASTQSQADALAQAQVDSYKQTYANNAGTCTGSITYVWGKIFESNPEIYKGATYSYVEIRTYIGGTSTTPPSDLSQPYNCTNPSIAISYIGSSNPSSPNNFSVGMSAEGNKLLIPPGGAPRYPRILTFIPGGGVGGSNEVLWCAFNGLAKDQWKLLQTI